MSIIRSAWRNQRLRKIIGAHMHQAQIQHQGSGKAARVFAEFQLSDPKELVLRTPRGGQGRVSR